MSWAGVLAIMYVISYLALGLPGVLAGLLVVHGTGLPRRPGTTGVMALAVLALLGLGRRARHEPCSPDNAPLAAGPDVLARAGCPARGAALGLSPARH